MNRIVLLLTAALCLAAGNIYAQDKSEAYNSKGIDCQKNKDYVGAFGWFKKSADAGNANGMYYLAFYYRDGQGGAERNYDQALHWFKESAGKGCKYAYCPLGSLFESSGKQDEAFKWYKKSAEAGFADGQYNLAMCYYNGVGTTTNDEEAMKWLRKSAEQGSSKAKYMLDEITNNPDAFNKPPVISFEGIQQDGDNASFSVCVKALTGRLTKNPVVYLNGKELPTTKWIGVVEKKGCDVYFDKKISNLDEGENVVRVEAANRAGKGINELKLNYSSGKLADVKMDLPATTKDDNYQLKASISSKSPITGVTLTVNEKKIPVTVPYGANEFVINETLELEKGINEVAVAVTNAAGEMTTGPKYIKLAKKIALVIGNADYKSVKKLGSPMKDAIGVASKLEENDFEVYRHIDATHYDMEKNVEEFCRKAEKCELALFYYSGHGIGAQKGDDNWLVPVDAPAQMCSETDRKHSCTSAKWVLEKMKEAGCDIKLMILDACRNYPECPMEKEPRTADKGFGGNKGKVEMIPVSGSIIAYAAGWGETAIGWEETNNYSPYTEAFLKTIDRKKEISVGDFFTLVKREFQTIVRKLKPESVPDPYFNNGMNALYSFPEGNLMQP